MFTGLIQTIGRLSEVQPIAEGVRFNIEATFDSPIILGESVAINGTCLTVTGFDERSFSADVIHETLRCTTLRDFKPDLRVNLERALQVGDRLGGHFVQGHVDGVGVVSAIHQRNDEYQIEIVPPSALMKYIAHKGSITLNGVSLTVSERTLDRFQVSLVPHTLMETTLGDLEVDDRVNLEIDLLARYLENLT